MLEIESESLNRLPTLDTEQKEVVELEVAVVLVVLVMVVEQIRVVLISVGYKSANSGHKAIRAHWWRRNITPWGGGPLLRSSHYTGRGKLSFGKIPTLHRVGGGDQGNSQGIRRTF